VASTSELELKRFGFQVEVVEEEVEVERLVLLCLLPQTVIMDLSIIHSVPDMHEVDP
jgi:hypothetical protein